MSAKRAKTTPTNYDNLVLGYCVEATKKEFYDDFHKLLRTRHGLVHLSAPTEHARFNNQYRELSTDIEMGITLGINLSDNLEFYGNYPDAFCFRGNHKTLYGSVVWFSLMDVAKGLTKQSEHEFINILIGEKYRNEALVIAHSIVQRKRAAEILMKLKNSVVEKTA